jgi:hypothetical protein
MTEATTLVHERTLTFSPSEGAVRVDIYAADEADDVVQPAPEALEDQLLDQIYAILQTAHLQCQPYFLKLASIWLPGSPVLRTESYISSVPTGPHARIDRASIALFDPAPDPPIVLA